MTCILPNFVSAQSLGTYLSIVAEGSPMTFSYCEPQGARRCDDVEVYPFGFMRLLLGRQLFFLAIVGDLGVQFFDV